MIFDLRPVSHITVDTIGRPGERVFYLQGSRSGQVITLIIEKQHALALVSGLDDMLAELSARPAAVKSPELSENDPGLKQPIEPLFRVGQMGLSYDESSDMVVLVAYQLAPPEEGQDVPAVRFWGTRRQMRALRDRALLAIEGGRPTCPFCNEMIGPDGHLCPRQNGHGNHPKFAL